MSESKSTWAVTYELYHIGFMLAVRHVPDRNGDKVIGELSRSNERCNIFLKRSRLLEPIHENILQVGQHFCYSVHQEKPLFLTCNLLEPVDLTIILLSKAANDA